MSLAFTTMSAAGARSHAYEKQLDVPTGLSFVGRSTSHRCGFLRVSTTEGAPQRVVGPPTVSSVPLPLGTTPPYDLDDVVGVGIHTAGTARITTDDRALLCGPGDVFVLDMTRPYAVSELDDFRLHLFRFPRVVLGLPLARTDVLWGVHPRTGDGVVPLLAPLLETLADSVASYARPVAHRLAGTVTDLLGTLSSELADFPRPGTEATGDSAPRAVAPHADAPHGDAVRRAMARRIRHHVNENLGDRTLSPETIAAHHHVSVRYLHKVFAHEGTTLSRWIQQRRLEECRRELGATGHTSVSVSAVAKRWGFVNSAHFSRRFRAVYGISPREWHRVRSGDQVPSTVPTTPS
ncbi:helix-turn-helix domain-containing protein [Streptomyces sp. NPDC090127]|uniref:helix-turn-helix domain-containing protein n=1 Tax=Streptomyces sp. NPDC090127 TaxID=3365953 RepID=UPI00382B5F3E